MFGPCDMYANVSVNPGGIATESIMDGGRGDLPSATKFILGWLGNVKFVDSSNTGSFDLRSYSNYSDVLVVYPNGNSDNRNWFFIEYVTRESTPEDKLSLTPFLDENRTVEHVMVKESVTKTDIAKAIGELSIEELEALTKTITALTDVKRNNKFLSLKDVA